MKLQYTKEDKKKIQAGDVLVIYSSSYDDQYNVLVVEFGDGFGLIELNGRDKWGIMSNAGRFKDLYHIQNSFSVVEHFSKDEWNLQPVRK